MDYRIITAVFFLTASTALADNGNGNDSYGFGANTFANGDSFASFSLEGTGEGEAIVQGFSSSKQTAQLSFGDMTFDEDVFGDNSTKTFTSIGDDVTAYTFGSDASGVKGSITGDAFGEVNTGANREGFAWAEFGNDFQGW